MTAVLNIELFSCSKNLDLLTRQDCFFTAPLKQIRQVRNIFSAFTYNKILNFYIFPEQNESLVEGVYVINEVIRFTQRLLNTALTSSSDLSLVLNSLLFYSWVITNSHIILPN